MRPGPTRIVACPTCRKTATYPSQPSPSIFGEIRWSDGYSRERAAIDPPPVVICRGCRRVHWLRDAAVLGEYEVVHHAEPSEDLDRANPLREPDEGEYYEALRDGLARDAAEERRARMLAWWKSNEPLRDPRGADPRWRSSAARDANLEALLDLTDERDAADRVLRIELLRELGRFREAIQILDRTPDAELGDLAGVMRDLCERRDDRMQRLDTDRFRSQGPRVPRRRAWWPF